MDSPALFAIGRLEAMCANQPAQRAMLDDLVLRMMQTLPDEVAAARAHWQAGRRSEAAALLHGARGAVASIGAQQFAEAARQAQRQLLQADASPEAIGAALGALDQVLAETLAAAQDWRARQAPRQ